MVVLVALLPRKRGMSKEDFHRHWRERHGPLVRDVLGQHLLAYEQYHRPPGSPGSSEEWDGIAIQRFESEAQFNSFITSPAYAKEVSADQDEFLDVGRVIWFIAQPPETII